MFYELKIQDRSNNYLLIYDNNVSIKNELIFRDGFISFIPNFLIYFTEESFEKINKNRNADSLDRLLFGEFVSDIEEKKGNYILLKEKKNSTNIVNFSNKLQELFKIEDTIVIKKFEQMSLNFRKYDSKIEGIYFCPINIKWTIKILK